MRIVQILPELNEGGVERGTVELSREYVKAGLESIVISAGGAMSGMIEEHGGRHITFDVCSKNPFTVPARVWGLRRILADLKPDIVHARSRVPAWLCVLVRRKLAFPFVTTIHGLNSVNRYSAVMTRGDHVICVSEVIEAHVRRHYGVAGGKITVIQRGVDTDYFSPQALDHDFMANFRSRFNLHGRIVLTNVGRITQLKDYESFIRAIALCRGDMPAIIGLLVGGVHADRRDYFASLKRLVQSEGVEDHIIFTGSQSRMPEIYAVGDMVVNASLKMGNVGRTVSEALAMNQPVLATSFPGLNDIIEDGRNGFIIKTQDPADLAEKIQRLHKLSLTDIRSSLSAEFTLQTMVRKNLEIYRALKLEFARCGSERTGSAQ